MADAKHPIRNSIIAALGAAAITGIAVYFVPGGWPTVFATAKKMARTCVTWLGSSVGLPAWLVLLLSVLAVVLVLAGLFLAIALLRKSGDSSDNFTVAEFFGVKWRWKYGEHGIYHIASFCPTCDLQVHAQNASTYRAVDRIVFRCDEGHWQSQDFECSYEELEDRVRRKIQQRLRKGIDQPNEKTA